MHRGRPQALKQVANPHRQPGKPVNTSPHPMASKAYPMPNAAKGSVVPANCAKAMGVRCRQARTTEPTNNNK